MPGWVASNQMALPSLPFDWNLPRVRRWWCDLDDVQKGIHLRLLKAGQLQDYVLVILHGSNPSAV